MVCEVDKKINEIINRIAENANIKKSGVVENYIDTNKLKQTVVSRIGETHPLDKIAVGNIGSKIVSITAAVLSEEELPNTADASKSMPLNTDKLEPTVNNSRTQNKQKTKEYKRIQTEYMKKAKKVFNKLSTASIQETRQMLVDGLVSAANGFNTGVVGSYDVIRDVIEIVPSRSDNKVDWTERVLDDVRQQYVSDNIAEDINNTLDINSKKEFEDKWSKVFKGKEDVLREIIDDSTSLANTDRIMTHELIHSVTVEYMKQYPNSMVAKRIEELYTIAKKEIRLGGNWKKNINEFIAEGLSDPELMMELARVGYKDNKGKLSSILDGLINIVSKILGIRDDNVLNALIDSVGYIAEWKNENKSTQSNTTVKTLVNKTATEKVKPKNRDKEFSSKFVRILQKQLGTKYGMHSTANDTAYVADVPSIDKTIDAVKTMLTNAFKITYDGDTNSRQYKQDLNEYLSTNTIKGLEQQLRNIAEYSGDRAASHELVHAGTLLFIKTVQQKIKEGTELTGKEKELYGKLDRLYKEALKHRKQITEIAPDNYTQTQYWSVSVEEFIAEAVSNPHLIKALSQIESAEKGIVGDKTLLDRIVRVVSQILGANKSVQNSVYKHTMDVLTNIIEENTKIKNTKITAADELLSQIAKSVYTEEC